MHQPLNPKKTGLALGALMGGIHFLWAILVALGLASALMNFILWAHMVTIVHVVNPFDPTAALVLVVITTFVGYVVGYAFAIAWNRIHRGQ